MDKKFFVPFETAKLCMDKGYNGENDYFWGKGKSHLKPRRVSNHKYGGTQVTSVNNNIVYGFENRLFDDKCFVECTAPTYHEVVDWLEEKGIYVTTCIDMLEVCGSGKIKWACFIFPFGGKETSIGGKHNREEAINEGILKALEML